MSEPESREARPSNLYSERTSLRTIVASLAVLIVGIIFLLIANGWDWLRNNHLTTTSLVRDIGTLLVATVAVTLLWELAAKRAFMAELMYRAKTSLGDLIAKTRLAEEVRGAGLKAYTTDFWYGINWLELFRNVQRLDLFFTYARSWLNSHGPQLQALAKRPGARVRIVLPNPNDAEIMAGLARRFSMTAEEVKNNIESTTKDLMKIFVDPFQADTKQRSPDFSLYYIAAAPLFTFYRFDHVTVLALYKHREGRGGIPIFSAEQGGSIYDFLLQEMDAFIDEKEGLATRVYPIPEGAGGTNESKRSGA